MKKTVFVILIFMICGFWGRDAVWQGGEHFWFSAFGYKNASIRDVRLTNGLGWWGCEVEVSYEGR